MIQEIGYTTLWYLLQGISLLIFSIVAVYLIALLRDIRREQKLYKDIKKNYYDYWIDRNLK